MSIAGSEFQRRASRPCLARFDVFRVRKSTTRHKGPQGALMKELGERAKPTRRNAAGCSVTSCAVHVASDALASMARK